MLFDRETWEMDEDALEENFSGDLDAEQELDFNEKSQWEHEGGRIYESIEAEVEGAVEEAAIQDIPEDGDIEDAINELEGTVEIRITDMFELEDA